MKKSCKFERRLVFIHRQDEGVVVHEYQGRDLVRVWNSNPDRKIPLRDLLECWENMLRRGEL